MNLRGWLKRRSHRANIPPIEAALIEIFRDHGITGTFEDGWIVFPNRVRIRGDVSSERTPSLNYSVQLDVFVEIESDRTICESFVGGGKNPDQAVAIAMQCCSVHSLHVLLAALFNKVYEQQIRHEKWNFGGLSRKVTIGNLGMRGAPHVQREVMRQLGDCVERFENHLKAAPIEPGTHWVRLFYAQAERLRC